MDIDNGIYIFEDFDAYHTLEKYNIINHISKYPNNNTKFVIILRKKIDNTNFINYINILPFTELETKKYASNFIPQISTYLIHEIFHITNGNPLLIQNILNLLSDSKYPINDVSKIIYQPCIVDNRGIPLDKIDESSKIIVTEINDQLLYELSQNPKELYDLSPYNFERVIARMFEKKGFTVKMTPQTRDGGKDIFIAKNDLCSFLFYVECKKYAPNQHVGIDVIQRLYGVISAEKATGGIIATTSYFTKPAKYYIQEHQLEHQLTLQDYNTISDILKSLQYNTK